MSYTISLNLVYEYKLKAGAFALENFYLFGVLFNKTYVKFPVSCTGVLVGIFYHEITKYRRCNPQEK